MNFKFQEIWDLSLKFFVASNMATASPPGLSDLAGTLFETITRRGERELWGSCEKSSIGRITHRATEKFSFPG